MYCSIFVTSVMELHYTNHFIPPEICIHILSNLPVKSLLRFRSVSKIWKAIIDDPNFASLHLNRNSDNRLETHLLVLERSNIDLGITDPRIWWFSRWETTEFADPQQQAIPLIPESETQTLAIAGAVNGLLLVRRRQNMRIVDAVLWNPSIRRSFSIPQLESLPDYADICLGFDPSTNDYKVVSIFCPDGIPIITLDIFSLNARSWRKTTVSGSEEEIYRLLSGDDHKLSLGAFVHWFGIDNYSPTIGLVSFNTTSEKFSYIPLPDLVEESDDQVVQPVIVAGSTIGLVSSCCGITSIWVLGRDDCWSKRFTFNTRIGHGYSRQFFLSKDGYLIYSEVDKTLSAADINTGEDLLVSEDRTCWPFYIGAYIQSLVLLN